MRPTLKLFAQLQALNQRAVAVFVLAFQVIQQLAAAAHQTQQATTGMMILDMILEMLCQVINPSSHQRNLDFGGAGVAFDALIISYNLRFLCSCYGHILSRSLKSGVFYSLMALLLKAYQGSDLLSRYPRQNSSGLDMESSYKGKTGLKRIWNALFYSIAGLCAAFRHEDAFRQEVALKPAIE